MHGPWYAAMSPYYLDHGSVHILFLGGWLLQDANRGRLLAAAYPQTVLGILEGYSDLLSTQASTSPSDLDYASCLTLEDFKVIKTAFGVLLNASMAYSKRSPLDVGHFLILLVRTRPFRTAREQSFRNYIAFDFLDISCWSLATSYLVIQQRFPCGIVDMEIGAISMVLAGNRDSPTN
jgi:hypothetical protein